MIEFKGKFQEACCTNRNIGYARMMEEFEAGWEYYLHCSCHICDLRRQENSKEKCVDKSCGGCKNLKEGKKTQDWYKAFSDVDRMEK